MRFTSQRNLFALLALTQSLLVLLGVTYLFNCFESMEMDTIRQQSITNTQASASQICTRFQSYQRELASADERKSKRLADQFRKATSDFQPGQDRFVCFIDATRGTVLHHRNRPEEVGHASLGSLPFLTTSKHEKASSLVDFFAENANVNSVSGILTINNQHWLGSAQRLRQDNGFVVVMQNESARMQKRAATLKQKRARSLLWTLLLSLIAFAAPILAVHLHEDQLLATNNNLERQATQNERELIRTRNAVIFGLAKLAESRDNDTGEHLDRIRKYVEILSRDLAQHFPDIDAEFTRNISLASSLHDIGKVGIPDSILLKPGRLTSEERSVMQIHTVIGGECLDAIHARLGSNPFMHMAREIAYYHHERWDGNGYPHQLKEDDIPLVARIVAVADVYDALTSKRPYKRAMSHLESRAIVLAGSGTQFDPEVVASFLRHEDEFEAISRGQQSLSNEQATSHFVKLHTMSQSADAVDAAASHVPS